MKPAPLIALAFCALPLFCGCERLGGLVGRGGGKISTGTAQPGGEVDPALAAEVRRGADGVSFRRDLEFPLDIRGRVRISREHDGVRVVEKSELGTDNRTLDHTLETEVVFEKLSGRFQITLEKAGRRIFTEEGESVSAPGGSSGLEGESLEFVLTDAGWMAVGEAGGSLRKAVWADAMSATISRMLVETGSHPRSQWFSSSRRWKSGDRVVLTGAAIKMIESADVAGRLELVFEGEEAVGGHPCGVFSVTGDLSVRGEVDFLGQTRDAEISIRKGRIWASLLHPVLMREEYETVQTIRSGEGGVASRTQGAIRVVKSRSWEPE